MSEVIKIIQIENYTINQLRICILLIINYLLYI